MKYADGYEIVIYPYDVDIISCTEFPNSLCLDGLVDSTMISITDTTVAISSLNLDLNHGAYKYNIRSYYKHWTGIWSDPNLFQIGNCDSTSWMDIDLYTDSGNYWIDENIWESGSCEVNNGD